MTDKDILEAIDMLNQKIDLVHQSLQLTDRHVDLLKQMINASMLTGKE